jgi:hypothetical protein
MREFVDDGQGVPVQIGREVGAEIQTHVSASKAELTVGVRPRAVLENPELGLVGRPAVIDDGDCAELNQTL